MFTFVVFVLAFVLICTSLFITLVILMQRPTTNSGLGSALGGGAVESVFGGETTKVLRKLTACGILIFFIVSFLLSVIYVSHHSPAEMDDDLPVIVEPINK